MLTYWRPLLRDLPGWAFECPHNTHWWDRDALPVAPSGPRSPHACCVLEARAGCHEYQIDGHTLRCLDGVRQKLVSDDPRLAIDLYGKGWTAAGEARIVREEGKFADREHACQIYSRYTFALIVENCDAEGYVSEKAYDAMSAGAIPLYYGASCPAWAVDVRQIQVLSDFLAGADVPAMRRALAEAAPAALRGVSHQAFASHLKGVMRWLDVPRVA